MCEIHYQGSPGTELGAREDLLTEHSRPPHTHTHVHTHTGEKRTEWVQKAQSTEPWLEREFGSSRMPSEGESVPRGVCLEILKGQFANPAWLGPSSGLLGKRQRDELSDLLGGSWV